MSRRFSWDYADVNLQQYLRGKNLVAGSLVDLDGSGSSDGPERDTLVELDVRNFSIGAWVNMDRIPSTVDPFSFFGVEAFPIFTRSAIAGNNGPGGIAFYIRGNAAGPRFQLSVSRATLGAFARSTSPPLLAGPGGWVFLGGMYVAAGSGPRLFFGDVSTPVVEASYFSQNDGSGVHGLVNPGVKASTGHWVDRWGFGPALLGTWTLPVPVNGPGQLYGELGPTNTVFASMQGLMAHVMVLAGVLTIAQWEQLRTTPPSARSGLQSQGFPPLIADWWLDASLIDRSGSGHHLESVLTQAGPALFDNTISTAALETGGRLYPEHWH